MVEPLKKFKLAVSVSKGSSEVLCVEGEIGTPYSVQGICVDYLNSAEIEGTRFIKIL